jgi:phosphoribosyl 1,2-cyclic phosphodiesterase
MRARIWGCRGSLATPGPTTLRTGGNTSCVELRSQAGAVTILDAGTGIRPLGAALAAEGMHEFDLLLTHLHLDHVEGLGFFAPLFDPEAIIRIWGPASGGALAGHIAGYLSPPLFPLRFADLPARVECREFGVDAREIGGLTVTAAPVCHPGPTVGYRLEEDGRSLVFIPDNEPALDRAAGVELARGANVLFHDAQYTDAEYTTRSGWGHASSSDFASFVQLTEPGEALMFHHDPAHADDELDALEATIRGLTGRPDIRLGREGMTFELA